MTTLRAPVKDLLRKATTTASVARMWGRIDARGRAGARARIQRRWVLAVAAFVLAILLVVGAWHRAPGASVSRDGGPVLRADGEPFAALRAEHERARLVLHEGTTITLEPGASIEPLSNSEHAVVLKQGLGRVAYDVTPGGPRRWTIECGAASVEVVGTSFDIDKAESRVRVEVRHGVVLVRGDSIPDRVARLTEGMSIDVAERTAASVREQPARAEVARTAGDTAPRVAASTSPLATTSGRAWQKYAARGENEKAYSELGRGGISLAARTASVEDLFALADVARLSGHPSEAVEPLQRIIANHSRDGRTPLAALTLGRIQLRSLRAPAEAARSLEKALGLGIPEGVAEDTYALLIESLATSGDRAGARAAHARFVARFPDSERASDVTKWIRDP